MDSKIPLVSAIILNYNEKEYLRNCLNSFLQVTYPNLEIIVSDNGSTDGSVAMVKKEFADPRIKLLENGENLGFSLGNNRGFEVSHGEIVLFINNDTEVEPDFLEPVVADFLEDENLGAIQNKILLLDERDRLDCAGDMLTIFGYLMHLGLNARTEDFTEKFEIFSPKGASMFFRRSVLEKIGLFDENYFRYFEETDLSWRTWLFGYRIIFEPNSVVYHKNGITLVKQSLFFNEFESYKNRLNSILKNASVVTLVYMLPLHILTCFFFAVVKIFDATLKDRLMFFKATLKAIGWNLKNLRPTLQKRRVVQTEIRKKKDREIMRKIVKFPQFWQSVKFFWNSTTLSKTGAEGLGKNVE